MKYYYFFLLLIFTSLQLFTSEGTAMPAHPNLLAKVKSGEIQKPYAMEHAREIRAAGVNAPQAGLTIQRLHQRSLDEDVNMLVILVDFSDNPANVSPVFFDSLMFGSAVSTVNHFYQTVTYGNLTLVSVNMPSALGWQRAPETYDYYVDGQNGFGNYPRNAQRLTEDAVQLVDDVVDFTHYDNDDDGYVDGIFIVHSGPGAEYSGSDNDIWSHKWQTRTIQHVDGVMVSVYSMEPEYWTQFGDMTCGVYAHEMGHAVFGLPDLYDTDGSSSGLSGWSLMAGGSWNGNNGDTPACPDAWCKMQMGAVTVNTVSSNIGEIHLPNVETTPIIYRLWTNGNQGNQFFLIENRRRIHYDAALPGEGLLIYHVDENVNVSNTREWYPGHTQNGHYLVALEQADGLWELEQNSGSNSGDPYPGSTQNRSFSNISTPNSHSYNDVNTYVSVRDIGNSADTMTVTIAVSAGAGNAVEVQLPELTVDAGDTICIPISVQDITAWNFTSFHFTLTWDPELVQTVAPYFNRTGSIIPPSWTVTQSHLPNSITVNASGGVSLAGSGDLICIVAQISPLANGGNTTQIVFSDIEFGPGDPEVDAGRGTLHFDAARINVQPTQLNFGVVHIGLTGERNMILRNLGNVALIIDSLILHTPFWTGLVGPYSILPAQWEPIQFTFTPSQAQVYLDTLIIYSNSASGPLRVPLSGTGTAVQDADDERSELPSRYSLSQCFPNPFNPSTEIRFSLPKAAELTLSVYDVSGRLLSVIAQGEFQAGEHRLSFDGTQLSTGVYLYRLETKEFTETRKMLLMK